MKTHSAEGWAVVTDATHPKGQTVLLDTIGTTQAEALLRREQLPNTVRKGEHLVKIKIEYLVQEGGGK
ncbi:hypothetical protein BWI97_15835 [Siphonobacter sp. BAB-5405]|uniref:hypothetical protein n=1 Tax=Siphonobacter sp. BAB-5405 TaxID=1864825 RepID=UPI000C80019F|nr:hypothetical protein [Siphonobacter sp. BAB-5405]PMD94866.1 hypothetical protein BWI97_15835 [Siphonobacter sp. BAB-5405]